MEKLPNIILVNDYNDDKQYVSLFTKYRKALMHYTEAYRSLEKAVNNFNQYRKKYNLEKINLW